jgi:hypothetical protein
MGLREWINRHTKMMTIGALVFVVAPPAIT